MHFNAHRALVQAKEWCEKLNREVDFAGFFHQLCVSDMFEKPARVEKESQSAMALALRIRIEKPELPSSKVAGFAGAPPDEVVLQAALPLFRVDAA